ncbi:hypothetical protein Y1Q_0010659 [Alligator mississippiensis]|uniref:Uncharacterized protein n=1 Tax=Alligator mississippiensis TaxID=8496 RepID=A0A151M6K3_ALLMI|nr:hypothetical protein Y1Q_0010659 [Alligator mississippiensis]
MLTALFCVEIGSGILVDAGHIHILNYHQLVEDHKSCMEKTVLNEVAGHPCAPVGSAIPEQTASPTLGKHGKMRLLFPRPSFPT